MNALLNNLMTLAVGYLQNGDLDSAERMLKQALTMAPKNTEALRLLGVTFAFKKDLQEALKALDKAIKVDPNNWLAHSNRGNVLKDLNQFDAALKSYDKTIALQPNYAEAYSNAGNALKKLNLLDLALSAYKKAMVLGDENELALAAYLSCKMQLCDWEGVEGRPQKIERGDIKRKDFLSVPYFVYLQFAPGY